jgi:hypothetical protein
VGRYVVENVVQPAVSAAAFLRENLNLSGPRGALHQAMEIEGTTFGTITIDGKTYEHDVIIRLSGEVVKRKKKLSKKYYGTSHVLSKDEAKFVFERGCKQLILGSGQMGNVHEPSVSPASSQTKIVI